MSSLKLKTSPFCKLSADHILEICKHLSATDLYHLTLTSRNTMTALRGLYKDIQLQSPDSAKGFCLLESMADPQTPYRARAFSSLRVDGDSPKDRPPLPRGRKGSGLVDNILERCLPDHPPSNIPPGMQDAIEEAYMVCRASLYASTCIGLASLALSITLAENLKSVEWLIAGTGIESTPLNLVKLIIAARVACNLPVFPKLRYLAWRLDITDTWVPIVPGLQRLIIHGATDQAVNFDLTAMINNTKSQLMEVAVLGMEMVVPLTELSLSGHLRHLCVLRMRDFARSYTQDYSKLFRYLGENSPQLETIDLDFEYMDFNDRTQPNISRSLQPDLRSLTNLKCAKIHTQLVWPSSFDMDLRKMYDMVPPNLEHLHLVGLNPDDLPELNEDGNDEQVESDEKDDSEMAGADEAEDDVSEQSDSDAFFLRRLCTILPRLRQLGFRFDFHAHTRPDLDEELETADQGLRNLVRGARALGLTLGVYVCCLESNLSDIFHMGDDIQAA